MPSAVESYLSRLMKSLPPESLGSFSTKAIPPKSIGKINYMGYPEAGTITFILISDQIVDHYSKIDLRSYQDHMAVK
jgi:hypothetical protein